MSTALEPPAVWNAVQLAERFGPIPLTRICMDPPPGQGTEDDVTWFNDHADKLYELVDGVLVEKTMGYYESMLAVEISRLIGNFVRPRKLGIVLGADGTLKLAPRLVRIPDVCFIAKDKFPSGKLPREPIPLLAPDLAIEVLSKHNSKKEMADKLVDYFTAGSRLVWYVDPKRREVSVFTGPSDCQIVDEKGTLDGEPVLPGFTLNLAELFADEPLAEKPE